MTQSDIINNNFSKAFECIKCSNAYDTGEVLSEEKLFKQISERKHSTSDKSKFTVVGSPTITDDGVASGFTQTSHINVNTIDISTVNSWEFGFKIKTGNDITTKQYYFSSKEVYKGFLVGISNSKIRFLIGTTGTSWNIHDGELISVSPNTEYYIRVGFTGNNYYFKYSTDNTTWQTVLSVTSSEKVLSNSLWVIGTVYFNQAQYTRGSIDLTQFSIEVDGKEVFNGNKTGLDVIKSDNYKVVGSPVISDDGVASGFSSSNRIRSLNQFNFHNKTFSIKMKFKQEDWTAQCRLFTASGIALSVSQDASSWTLGRFVIFITTDSGSIASYASSDRCITKNQYNYVKFIYDGSKYTVQHSLDDKTYTTVYTLNSTDSPKNTDRLIDIGSEISDVAYINYIGSIDLNAFKIYVDGNLVYQPCLKIPYTLSKTGSKIVDVAYRDRVIDLYEQEGQAGYYTIDEENKNFTLPMGEIYGMIGQRSLISSTVTETNRVDIYSDKTCLICGNVATAGTINLPIELVNKNYFITLSTSAKTATSFTTTATGDYILIGKVV